MATLQHVQDSAQAKVKREEPAFIPTITDETPVSTEPPFYVFKLVEWRKNFYLDGICHNVDNPKTKNVDTIWLIRGAHSIWESDLKEIVKDIDKTGSRINRNRLSLHFQDGICRIPSHEKFQLEFARAHKSNVGRNRVGAGKYAFYEYNPAEEQKWRMEKQMDKIKLIQTIATMEEAPMKKLAFWFNIAANDDYGFPKTAEGIRDELLLIADSRPNDVKKYIGSNEVEISYMIRKAISEAKIDLQGQAGNAIWASGKGFIAKLPHGRKPHEYLTELAMTNSEEGRTFKQQLESFVV